VRFSPSTSTVSPSRSARYARLNAPLFLPSEKEPEPSVRHRAPGNGRHGARTLPRQHRDWARPIPHLHRDWAHPDHICTGTGLTPNHICTGTRQRGTGLRSVWLCGLQLVSKSSEEVLELLDQMQAHCHARTAWLIECTIAPRSPVGAIPASLGATAE
jgi:hypothetical protein